MNKFTHTVGFMFDVGLQHVALIRKNRPDWQAGKLNGIGGHIEPNESLLECMTREFFEETGMETGYGRWTHFATLHEEGEWKVACFHTVGEVYNLETTTDENIVIVPIRILQHGHPNMKSSPMIDNIPWLVNLAMDNLIDGRPKMVEVNYPSRSHVSSVRNG